MPSVVPTWLRRWLYYVTYTYTTAVSRCKNTILRCNVQNAIADTIQRTHKTITPYDYAHEIAEAETYLRDQSRGSEICSEKPREKSLSLPLKLNVKVSR